jgi:hypothetical protein
VPGDRPVGLRRRQRRHARRLGGAGRGALVVLREHPLDGHDVRAVLAEQRRHRGVQLQEAQLEIELGHRPDHADPQSGGPGTGTPVHHTPSAPGEARVDAEHPHGASCRQPNWCSTHANRSAPGGGHNTRCVQAVIFSMTSSDTS